MKTFMKLARPVYLLIAFLTALPTTPLKDAIGSDAVAVKKREVLPFSGQFKVHRSTFSNGLRLLVIEDHSSPTFAYQTWFSVGSRNESQGKTGLAHLFEHMMFKETKNMKEGEFDRLLESAGAQGENAFTSRDYTAYIQELPKDRIELIVKAEADRMVNLIINEKSFKTEREVVQNERRFRNENSPDGMMDQELFALAFKKHPYHWPVIGYQQDLDRMSGEDARKFYQNFYSPNHATIIAVGDLDPREVEALVEKYYGHLAPQVSASPNIPAEPPQTSPRKKELKLTIQVEKLLAGYHIPALSSPDIPTLNVIQALLTNGKSSRLNRALVETGVASSVNAYDLEDKDPSLLVISVNLQKNRRAAEAERILIRELASLSQKLITTDELQSVKNRIAFSFYQGLESNFEKAYFLGHYEVTSGDFEEGIKLLEKIQAVTASDIQKVAKKYLAPANRSVITGVKK